MTITCTRTESSCVSRSVCPNRTGVTAPAPLTAASRSPTSGAKAPGAITCTLPPACRSTTRAKVSDMAALAPATVISMASTTMTSAKV